MPIFEVPFAGGWRKDPEPFQSPEETINYYLETYPTQDGEKFVLRGTPGLLEVKDIETDVPIRGTIASGNPELLYVVCGNKLYSVNSDAEATTISGTFSSSSGPVTMATNGLQILIADGPNGYVYTIATNTLEGISSVNWEGASSVTYQDGFFFVTVPDTARFRKSRLNDALTWDADDFATEAWLPDNLITSISYQGNLWLFGELSTVPWYNVGAATNFGFLRRDGVQFEVGITAKDSVGVIDNAVYWLGQNNDGDSQIYRALGFQSQIISNDALTKTIRSFTKIDDAIGFTYQENNHSFYEICFPTEDRSFAFDTRLDPNRGWIETQSRRTVADRVVTGRHLVQNNTFFAGNNVLGSAFDSKLYIFVNNLQFDGDEKIVSSRTSMVFSVKDQNITIHNVQILFAPGQGTSSGQGSDPEAILSYSKDGGITFGNERQIKVGKIGEYEVRAKDWQFGQGRKWVFKVKMSDPAPRDIFGFLVEATVDRSN